MEKKRSIGVTIFACFYLLNALVTPFMMLPFKWQFAIYQAKYVTLPGSYYYAAQGRGIINAIVGLVIGIGLLKLLRWARLLPIVITIANMICNIAFYLLYTRPYIIPYFVQENKPIFIPCLSYVLHFLIVAIVIYFFTRPKVKEQFK